MQGWIFKRLETMCVVFCLVVVAENLLYTTTNGLGYVIKLQATQQRSFARTDLPPPLI